MSRIPIDTGGFVAGGRWFIRCGDVGFGFTCRGGEGGATAAAVVVVVMMGGGGIEWYMSSYRSCRDTL